MNESVPLPASNMPAGERAVARHEAAMQVRSFVYAVAVVGASLGLTLWFGVGQGQDFNWDQRNYHIGIPAMLRAGTFWASVAPAGIQSYFNPSVQQAQFFAMRHLGPFPFAAVLSSMQSAAFMLAGAICAAVARPAGGVRALTLSLLGFALCLMAPMTLSEAGGTFIDFVTAVPVIGAYALLLGRLRLASPVRAGLAAGALLGLATGLKLTNGMFALGVVGFALAGPETLRRRGLMLLACGVAAAVAFAVIGGPWHLGLLQRFGSPTFPYYNNIFHSPDVLSQAWRDARFLPQSALDIWRYPLYWLRGGSPIPGQGSPSSELPFQDARWIVFTVGVPVVLAGMVASGRVRQRMADPALGLLFAVVIDYLVWLAEFGIHRYMVPLEILCGAGLLVLAMQLPSRWLGAGSLAAVAGLSLAVIKVPDWQRLPWQPYWQGINPSPLVLPGPALVFLTAKPSTFVAASLPPETLYAGIVGDFDLRADSDTRLARQLRDILARKPPLLLRELDEGAVPPVPAAILASNGLVATDRCQPLTAANVTFRLCEVDRRP